jgi:hypothetical protein
MRMMTRAKIPVEAVYVGSEDGVRSVPIFFGLKDLSDATKVDS